MADRDKNGRFVKGHAPSNNGNGGRPKRSTEEKYLKALLGQVTIKDWRVIVNTTVARAKAGDKDARKWLSDYLLGPPVQRIDAKTEGDMLIRIIGGIAGTPTDPTS